WPALAALDQEPHGVTVAWHRRRIKRRHAGDDVGGHAGVGHDLARHFGRAATRRQRERPAGELHERAAIDDRWWFSGTGGELRSAGLFSVELAQAAPGSLVVADREESFAHDGL